MMDMILHSAYPGRHFSGFMSGRCSRCGQGMIVGCDGFMMVRCDTCGRYLANEPSDFGFGIRPIKAAIKDLFQGLKRRVVATIRKVPEAAIAATPEGV
jgi:ribosomal protein S27E